MAARKKLSSDWKRLPAPQRLGRELRDESNSPSPDQKKIAALLAAGASTDVRDINGSTALIWLSYHRRAELAQLMIDNGADVAVQDTSGRTALMWAAWHGEEDLVASLLAAKAPVDAQDRAKETALIYAVEKGRVGAVRALIAAGASLEQKDRDGKTLSDIAAENDSGKEIVQILEQEHLRRHAAAMDAAARRATTLNRPIQPAKPIRLRPPDGKGG